LKLKKGMRIWIDNQEWIIKECLDKYHIAVISRKAKDYLEDEYYPSSPRVHDLMTKKRELREALAKVKIELEEIWYDFIETGEEP
jgi:hypothetical protein